PALPARVAGHAYLRVDAAGVVEGAVSSGAAGRAFLRPVTGRIEGDEIVLEAAEVTRSREESLQWNELRLALLDQDGDGAVDGAIGDAAGKWQVLSGDVVSSADYTATITATLDTATAAASLEETGTLLPFDPVTIHFAEPVRRDQAEATVRVLGGGVAVAGSFTGSSVEGMITRLRFQPSEFLPFDQPFSIDTGALRDPSGNAITGGSTSLRVVPDPTVLTDNLGFEDGLRGWVVRGQAEAVTNFGGVAPAEGQRQALIRAVGALAAYVDLPADAAALHFSLVRMSQFEETAGDHAAMIVLHRAGGEAIVGFADQDVRDAIVPCTTCGSEFRFQLGPLTRNIDLSPFQGERVWLTIEARSFFFIGMPALAVLVDDLQVITPRSIRAQL
ncbi:MAG: hypothetical protein H7138_18085, partial [Myxococcales bacterium]|nr:hypothetical protein [Myxococcales bacterium]